MNISIKLEGIEMLAAKLDSIAGGSALQNGCVAVVSTGCGDYLLSLIF